MWSIKVYCKRKFKLIVIELSDDGNVELDRIQHTGTSDELMPHVRELLDFFHGKKLQEEIRWKYKEQYTGNYYIDRNENRFLILYHTALVECERCFRRMNPIEIEGHICKL